MRSDEKYIQGLCVALRKESVDRNAVIGAGVGPLVLSLSARRAWIEIFPGVLQQYLTIVALRKESVDRNIPALGRGLFLTSRSPQGERG